MSEELSEDRPLLKAESSTETRSPWLSLGILLVFQVVIFTSDEVTISTLGVQLAHSVFARQHGLDPPAGGGGNACDPAALNGSTVMNDVQSETALFTMYSTFLTELIPVVTGLPLIALSDFTGRRTVLMLSAAGTLAMSLGYLVVSFFHLSVYFALLGYAVFGLTGGFVLQQSVSMLYATDIIPEKHLAVALAAVYGVQYSVIYVAPMALSMLLEATSSCFPLVYLVTTLACLLALGMLLPPDYIREFIQRRPVESGLISEMYRGIRHMFQAATNGRRWRLLVLLASYAMVAFTLQGFQNTVNLYALGEPFCWSPSEIGIFSLVYGVPNAICKYQNTRRRLGENKNVKNSKEQHAVELLRNIISYSNRFQTFTHPPSLPRNFIGEFHRLNRLLWPVGGHWSVCIM